MDCQIIIMIFQVTSLVTAHSQDERSYFYAGYIGCFTDRGTRILPISLDHSKTNTGRECMQRCMQKGYRYGGTEASNRCFCGETLIGTKVPHAECRRICSGNSSEYCGGDWRIAVYDNDAANKMKRPPGYLGCFKQANVEDGTKQRTMSHEMYKDCATNTGNQCKRRCKISGYNYAGTEYGTECFCGNTLPDDKVLDTECYYTCPGDRNEYCGGDWRLSVYEITPKKTTKMSTSTPISTISTSTIYQVSPTQELSSTMSYYMTSTSRAVMTTSKVTSSRNSVSSSSISQVSASNKWVTSGAGRPVYFIRNAKMNHGCCNDFCNLLTPKSHVAVLDKDAELWLEKNKLTEASENYWIDKTGQLQNECYYITGANKQRETHCHGYQRSCREATFTSRVRKASSCSLKYRCICQRRV